MQHSITFNLRPVKIAYFVDGENIEAFAEIARFCCTQWGGINNFIIPVTPSGVPPYFRNVLSAHPPDKVVSACSAHKAGFEEFCLLHLDGMVVHDWQFYKKYDQVLHPLAVYRTTLLSGIPTERLTVYIGPKSADALVCACIIAAFGQVWPGQEEDYWHTFSAHRVDLDGKDHVFLKQQMSRDPLESPINLTGVEIATQYSLNMPHKLHVDIIVPNTVLDLCLFWNLRAIENVGVRVGFDAVRRTVIVPPPLFARAQFRRLLLDTIRPVLVDPFRSSTLDVNVLTRGNQGQRRRVWSAIRRTEREGTIQPLKERLSTKQCFGQPRDDLGRDRHALGEPMVYTYNMQPWLPDAYRETADIVSLRDVELREGVNELYSPSRSIAFSGLGEIMLDVQSDYWARYPRHSSVASDILQNSKFSDYGLSARVYPQSSETQHQLTIISEQQALDAFFRAKGYMVRRETISQRAQTLIDLMGGIDECEFLRRRAVLHVLEKLAVKTANKLSQDIVSQLIGRMRVANMPPREREELAEVVRSVLIQTDVSLAVPRMTATVDALRREPELRQSWSEIVPILDQLVRRQIIFRGFHVKCENCGTPTWHALNVAQEIIQCPGCFHKFPLSVMVDGGRERAWEYTLNTSVNRAMDQDVLAPILLLTKLAKERHPIYGQTIGLKLGTQPSPDIGDFDVVFVKEQRVYAGECKMGSEFKDKDIRMAELARDLGCSGFFFASCGGLDERSRQLIEGLKAKLASSDKPFEVRVYEENDLLVDR